MAEASLQSTPALQLLAKKKISWTTVAVSPLLYGMTIPLIILDLFLELYRRIAFPSLGIPIVSRRQYIRIDRHLLPYLTPIQKVACAYCGYCQRLDSIRRTDCGGHGDLFLSDQTPTVGRLPCSDALKYGDAEGLRQRWNH